MSNSLQLYEPVKLLSCVQLFVTLWTVAHQAPLSVGFSRQEYWSGLPCLPPWDLSNPGIEPMCSALQAYSLLSDSSGKPLILTKQPKNHQTPLENNYIILKVFILKQTNITKFRK